MAGDGDMGLICVCEQTRSLRERNEKWDEMRAEDQNPEEHCQLGTREGCGCMGKPGEMQVTEAESLETQSVVSCVSATERLDMMRAQTWHWVRP